jgi:hypothetical protein
MARMDINALDLPRCLKMDRPLIDAFKRANAVTLFDAPRKKTPLSELKGGVGSRLLTDQQQQNIRDRARMRAKAREEQRKLNAKLVEQKKKAEIAKYQQQSA